MEDEKWHIQWIGEALKSMENEFGADLIKATLERFQAADRQVYATVLAEHEERVKDLFVKAEVSK